MLNREQRQHINTGNTHQNFTNNILLCYACVDLCCKYDLCWNIRVFWKIILLKHKIAIDFNLQKVKRVVTENEDKVMLWTYDIGSRYSGIINVVRLRHSYFEII